MSDEQVRECARRSVAEFERVAALEDAERKRLEAEGYRLVNGGQTGTYDDDGKADWEVSDYRTGERLISSHGTYDDYDAAVDREESARGERWYQADNLWHNLAIPVAKCPAVEGIPPSLADVIHTWVADGAPEDVAAFTGFSLARIQAMQS